jgi:hypothetical protein
MRAGPSVCLKLFGAAPLVVAGLVFAFTAGLGVSASAADQVIQAQADVEQPAEVAPGDEDTLFEDDESEPKTLDRSFMRPDLKGGSEDAPPPQSTEESKQDKLDPSAEAELPLPTPVERPKMLGELYEQLGKAADAEQAAPIAEAIETLWLTTDRRNLPN